MYRILLACEDEYITKGIQNSLDENYAVECCGTAQWALQLFNSFQPDVVLVTNGLPDMDPIDFVRIIRSTDEHFAITLLTTVSSPTIVRQVQAMKIDSMHIKPCKPSYLAAHIQSLALALQKPDSSDWTAEDALFILLSDLGFCPGTERYYHACRTVLAKYYGGEDMLMKNVYLEVAKKYNGSMEQIEKGLRDAIRAAWDNGNKHIWKLYFRPRNGQEPIRPKNDEFVARIALGLKRRERYKLPVEQKKIG
jgi:DNA-binding response OmpR family regulator